METELTRIYLGGILGKKFGQEWNLYVSSPSEAIKAINVNTGGKLRAYLSKHGHNKFYKVALGSKKNNVSRAELGNRSGTTDIYILPTIQGAQSGFGKIIAGVILIAVAYFSGYVGASGFAGTLAAGVVDTGISLVLGGIVQLLTPTTPFGDNSSATAGSNIFQGNATAVFQGLAVPLVYGRALTSPLPISIAFSNFDQSPNFGGSDGGGGSDNNPAGGGGSTGGGGGSAGDFSGGTYMPYTPSTDPGTGIVSYTQSTTPVVVRPVSY